MFIFLFVAYRLRLRRHQHHLIVTIFLVVNVAIVATVLYPPLFVTFHPPVSPLNLLHTSGSWLISYNMNVHRLHAANFLDAFSSLLLFFIIVHNRQTNYSCNSVTYELHVYWMDLYNCRLTANGGVVHIDIFIV